MPRRRNPIRTVLTALAAAAALLVIANAAVIPGPWHDGLAGRSCDVCRSGHLPILASLAPVAVPAPLEPAWQVAAEDERPAAAPESRTGAPRAPPA